MKTRASRSGSAILTVLGIITVVSIVSGMLSFSATQQMRSGQITRDMLRARLIAESGLNKAYNSVRSDFASAVSYAATDSLGGGTCTVTAQPQSEGAERRVQLTSEGVCGMGRAKVTVDLENRPVVEPAEGSEDNFFPLSYDVLVGASMTITGNFNAEVAAFHANGAVVVQGSSSSVEVPTFSSASTVTFKGAAKNNIGKTAVALSGQPSQAISSAALTAAINSLKAYAESHGAVYASGSDIPANPPGGVAYCTGSSDGWNKVGTGCFIFDGAFNAVANVKITAVDGYPALIVTSVDDVKFAGHTEIDGALILPNASLMLSGQAVIYGPVLIGQDWKGTGSAELFAGDGQGFSLPPEEQVTDNVVVTTWH